MLNRKLTLMTLLVLTLCLLFTSCNASTKNDYAGGSSVSPSDPEVNGDYGYGNGSAKLPETSDTTSDSVVDETLAQKIIRTVYMDAQTKEFDEAITEIRATLKESGGFEESFRSNNRSYGSTGNYARTASMTLRIPAEKLDDFLSEVGGMVHITSQNSNVQNVTSEYYDIEARLNVLESERLVYENMLQKATTTSEMLSIRDRLYNVIEEIEAYETRLRVLDSQVAYSTVTMNLSEVVEYSKVTSTTDPFSDRISDAFWTGWNEFVENSQDFAVWFVGALPTIVILVIIGGVVLTVVLIMNKKHARAAKARPTQPKENE